MTLSGQSNLVIENCSDALIICDQDRKIINANQNSVKLFKIDLSELLQLNPEDIFPAEIMQCLIRQNDCLPEKLDIEVADKKGKIIPVRVRIRILIKSKKEKTFYIFLQDLRERQRLLNELNERSKELACLYSIDKAKEEKGSLVEIFTNIANHIVIGLQVPDEASASITYSGHTYKSRKFKATTNFISEKIMVEKEEKGVVRMYYPEERKFLLNEKNLLGALAQNIYRIIKRKEYEERMVQDRNNLVNIIREVGIGISLIDKDFRISWANELLEQWFGDLSAIKGTHCYQTYHQKKKICKDCPLERTFLKGTVEVKTMCVNLSGTKRYYQLTTAPVFDKHNQVIQVLSLSQDITDVRKMEAKLKQYSENLEAMVAQRTEQLIESEEKYRTFMENSSDLMGILDNEGRFEYTNESFARVLGYKKTKLLGTNIRKIIDPEEIFSFDREVEALKINGKITQVRLKLCTSDKQKKIVGELNATAILDQDNNYKGARIIIRDITRRIMAEEKIKKLIITDNLTGLYNQRHFYDQLSKEVERAIRANRPLSLLLFDIDNFKDYNDSFGHLEGDKVLAKIGNVVFRHIRNIDLGFRYGGEEFTIILPDSDINQALRVAKRLRDAFSSCLFMPESKSEDLILVYKTISIGIAEYRLGENFKALIKNADDAMYIAKRAGGDRIHIFHAYHS